uniref:Uncharacterized protein n=1 Tax=Arundo donax TaxID=35708 RepID=A0A0A9FLD0_ARUDO
MNNTPHKARSITYSPSPQIQIQTLALADRGIDTAGRAAGHRSLLRPSVSSPSSALVPPSRQIRCAVLCLLDRPRRPLPPHGLARSVRLLPWWLAAWPLLVCHVLPWASSRAPDPASKPPNILLGKRSSQATGKDGRGGYQLQEEAIGCARHRQALAATEEAAAAAAASTALAASPTRSCARSSPSCSPRTPRAPKPSPPGGLIPGAPPR